MADRPVDYRRFSKDGDPTAAAGANSVAWWTRKGDEIASSVSAVLAQLQDNQRARVAQAITSARLYGNVSLAGMYGDMTKLSAPSALQDRISCNVIQSVVDTVTAKITKNRPKPLFLTSGGDYKRIRRAKRLNKFVDGVFYENNFHKLAAKVFRDACILDGGVIHVYADNGRVKFERVLSPELVVDEREAFHGDPRQLHRIKPVDRKVLQAAFPDFAEKLEDTAKTTTEGGAQQSISDLVTLRQSWHLRSGPKADDGRCILSVDGLVLTPEEEQRYDADYFPFAIMPWCQRLTGIWSQPLSEQIQNIQLEINKLLWVIQRSFHLMGSFKIFLENSSKVTNESFNNSIGTIVRFTGTKPSYETPPAVQPEIFAHLETLIRKAYEQAGVTMMSATGQKPPGLDAAVALREYNDLQTERFDSVGKAYEQLSLDVARLALAVVRDDLSGKYEVKVPDGKRVQILKWADVQMDEADYVMQCYPISSLPSDPAGRLQTIQEYTQAGFLTQRQGRRLLDFPDLEAQEGLANAEEDYLGSIMDKIVDEGEYTPPEPFDDLDLAMEVALETYALGKSQALEESRLEMLRRFMAQVRDLKAAATPPPDPTLPAPGAVPQAQPMPPPQSDLLPMH